MVSEHVLGLCTSPETVTAALARAPDQSVASVVKSLFKKKGSAVKEKAESPSADDGLGELDLAEKCGRFPHRPSDLFLKVYNDVLHTLDKDPLAGLVSPSLLGSSGVIPLSIVSVIPDIMRHYADLIVRAEKEIFLATNYWEPSLSAGIVSDSLRELSKRVQARSGEKVVVKLMYDRGNLKQVVSNHVVVKPDGWSKVGLPTEEELPGINLEVVNYHRPPLGTFHAKYLVVDRRVACLNSNNIQDRPNVEMMVHLEGPIVESFYDMALLSWSNAMHPPLPLLGKPPTYPDAYKFKQDNEGLRSHLNIVKELEATVRDGDGITLDDFRPHILHEPHGPVPIVMVNRNSTGTPGHDHVHEVPQDVAWLSAFRYAQKSIFIQTPTFNASPVVPATLDACRRGVQVTLYLDLGFNDQGEMIPFQGGTNEEVVHKMYTTLNSEGKGAEKHLEVFWYTGKDQTKPISAAMKSRNCHVKFMSVDDQIAILGNGNQDTQSWFHSQEINVMVDSPELIKEWLRGINANQNTRVFGRVSDKDGVWRGSDGEAVQASGTETSSFFGRLKGLGGAVARVRGTGGF
ncbi:hypothetical protein BC834DRAFT_1011250 [Gloeopeniophorella convolvens]|nr:hypothetical protein BC834DRAFT_1011250 [Gloeopeniophorella convolvens]